MPVFSEGLDGQIASLLVRFETPRSAVLPILHVLQDHYGWIKPEHFEALEDGFQLPSVWTYEVATFYSMYRTVEPKAVRVHVCDNIVCATMGAQALKEKIKDVVSCAERSSQVSVDGIPCLGVCDGAPCMMINKTRYYRVKPTQVASIIDKHVSG